MENNINVKQVDKKIHPFVKEYDQNGKPVFKKRIKEVSILNKRDSTEKVLYAVIFTFFLIQAITLVLPFLWMIMTSLKGAEEYFLQDDPFALPTVWHFSNYIDAFSKLKVMSQTGKEINFLQMTVNSLWYSAIKTVLFVMVPAICGYVMCKFTFWGREIILAYAIFTLTFPIYGSGAAMMKLIHAIGLYDNPLYVPLTTLYGFGTTFFVYIGFFKGVSNSYAEAAKIEGANEFQIMFKIVMPQATPILMTYAITTMINSLNTYEDLILYLPSYLNIAAGLSRFENSSEAIQNKPFYFAGVLIANIPSLVLFTTFSSKIMTSLSIGGLKG